MRILALDMSSVVLGVAVAVDGTIEHFNHIDLSGDVAARCFAAANAVGHLIDAYLPALVVVEKTIFVNSHSAALVQAFVAGAVRGEFGRRQTLYQEVSPDAGIIALCGAKPKQDKALTKAQNRFNRKAASVKAAALLLGLPAADVRTVKGKVCAVAAGGTVMLTEDEADAIGLALAGLAVKVERVAA